jgi:diacylglycerol kinase (ATP)
MAKPGNIGVRRIVNATLFSVAGLRAAWRNEAAFRQECALAVVLIPAALWVGRTGAERALLIGSCLLMLIVELLNTAIECVVDRIGADHHDLSGRAKDVASAAVFVSLCVVLATWALIVWDRFSAAV